LDQSNHQKLNCKKLRINTLIKGKNWFYQVIFNTNIMNEKLKKIIDIFNNKDFDNSTTENKVLLEIDKILEK
jgi:hypothetical protein